MNSETDINTQKTQVVEHSKVNKYSLGQDHTRNKSSYAEPENFICRQSTRKKKLSFDTMLESYFNFDPSTIDEESDSDSDFNEYLDDETSSTESDESSLFACDSDHNREIFEDTQDMDNNKDDEAEKYKKRKLDDLEPEDP